MADADLFSLLTLASWITPRVMSHLYTNIPPTRKCNRRGVSFNPLKVGVRDARVSVEFEIQRHPALISSLTPASECHTPRLRTKPGAWPRIPLLP